MTEQVITVDFPVVDTQYGVDQLEALLDRLFDPGDLPTSLSQGLRYVLGLLKRSSGFVIIQEPDEAEPELWVVEGSARKLLIQLEDPASLLRQACRTYIGGSGVEILPEPDMPMVIYPVSTSSRQLGVLAISGRQGLPAETAILGQTGRILGRVADNYRKHPQYSDEARIQKILNVIVSSFCSDQPLDEIQTQILKGICSWFRCEGAVVAFGEDDQPGALNKISLVENEDWVKLRSVVAFQGLMQECIQTSRVIRSNQISRAAGYIPDVDGILGLRTTSILCLPLLPGEKWYGVLALHNKKDGGFTPYDQSLLLSIVESMGTMCAYLFNSSQWQKNVEDSVRQWDFIRSPETLRSLVDNMPNPLYIVDQSYRLLMVNAARVRHNIPGREQLVGGFCFEQLYQRSEPCPGCLVSDSLYNFKNTSRVMREWGIDGTTQEWEVNTYPIKDKRGQVVQAVVFEQDVTEKNRLEAMVAQSEKLAAVGQLAAGFAHEINNPLTVILANAQILLRELPPDSDWADAVDLIERAGSRAQHVMQNVLNFARKEEYEFRPTDINNTIENALDMLKHELVSRELELVFEPADKLPQVMASADHLQSVWVNIIINAMDATTHPEGRIRVATDRLEHEIRISINDNGQGIAPENLKRIFDPFYTTKEPGRGTGLGLSVCHRTIKQHGGSIQVESLPGVGTTFIIMLPVY